MADPAQDAANCSKEEEPTTPTDKKPPKGILKHKHDSHAAPEVKWDEMNILKTYHPADKDYGHMKIDEPPTPYNREQIEDEEDSMEGVDPNQLAANLEKANTRSDYVDPLSEEDDDADLTPEALAHKKEFREHRKKHYNEFSKVKMARALIEKELAELEDDEDAENMETSPKT